GVRDRDATGGGVLVRRELDGHWLPEGLLPPLSPLRLLFPAPRLLPLPPERGPRAARGGVCALRAGDRMRFPLHITTDMIRNQVRNAWRGNKRYPFVLMLEPLYACNLACIGCATERHTGKVADRLTIEQCLRAVDDCGAPGVSICGGEPTIYPELKELVAGIISRRRHIYLCTNALLLDEKVYGVIPPHKRLTINVHLDGMRRTHDRVCASEGVFDKAVAMIREGKRLGYHVMTNTTVFKDTEIGEVKALCEL